MPEGPLRARLGTGRARYMVLVVERIELDVDVCRSVGNCLQLCRRRVHPKLPSGSAFRSSDVRSDLTFEDDLSLPFNYYVPILLSRLLESFFLNANQHTIFYPSVSQYKAL